MNDVRRQAPNPKRRPPCIEVLDDAMVEVLRGKTKTERVAMVFEAERIVRTRMEAHLRSIHPNWDTKTVMREIARRWLHGDAELLWREFGEKDVIGTTDLDA